jgi:hypothetical protein
VAAMVIPIDRLRQMQARKPATAKPPKGGSDDDPPPASRALAA